MRAPLRSWLLVRWLWLASLASCAPPDAIAASGALALTTLDEGDAGTFDPDAGSPSYRKVREIISRSCSYPRCHAAPLVGGGLSLAKDTDYRAALIGVEACEYERMALVEPYAPERSWLMVKLTARARPLDDPYGTYIYFDPPSDWDPGARRCVDQTDDGIPLFGQRMPATAPNLLPADEVEIIRAWIAEGAPP